MTELRLLNEQGIERFREFLDSGAMGEPPYAILRDPGTSISFASDLQVDQRVFTSKLEAARYLAKLLTDLNPADVDHNKGLWTWLALLYFKQLCPTEPDGSREVGEQYRYILSNDYRHYYRNLLAGPYSIFKLHGEKARVILHPPVHRHGDFAEQLASRQEFITNRGLLEVADTLYYDPQANTPKPGATNRRRPGNVRRLVMLVQQLDLTYDLYGMSAQQILALLPPEFNAWRSAPP